MDAGILMATRDKQLKTKQRIESFNVKLLTDVLNIKIDCVKHLNLVKFTLPTDKTQTQSVEKSISETAKACKKISSGFTRGLDGNFFDNEMLQSGWGQN